MLRIRFSRTGKVGQPSYRIVVAEHHAPVKGRYIEMLGHYLPALKPKVVSLKKERIFYWMSKGACPSDSVASLLKKEGLENMDRYLLPRNRKRTKKGEEKAAPAQTAAASAAEPAPAVSQ